MRNGRQTFAVLLGIIAVLAIAAGVIYLAVPAHSLPTFIPGYVKQSGAKTHSRRGLAGVAVGVILLVISVVMARSGRRRRRFR